jgi:hypothetical protein
MKCSQGLKHLSLSAVLGVRLEHDYNWNREKYEDYAIIPVTEGFALSSIYTRYMPLKEKSRAEGDGALHICNLFSLSPLLQ